MVKNFLVSSIFFILNITVVCAQESPSFLNASDNELYEREQWVDSVYNSLSLEERIGQLFIYTFSPSTAKQNIAHVRRIIEDYHIGGVLFSGGEVADQVKLMNMAQRESKVPLMVTFDGEWGLSMRLKNTPKFPRNMVLGCITDEKLIYAYGQEMGRQCNDLGVHVNFAPVADVNINPNNPVINTRSFGESPENVASKIIAYSKGLESQNVLSVVKHFPGHGDTNIDSHKSLPTLPFDRARLDSVELYPFAAYVKAKLGGVMVGHLNIPALDNSGKVPSSLSRPIISDLLKDSIGFQGLVFTDALEMRGVSLHNDVCLKAILAGNDMLLTPRRLKKEMEAIVEAIDKGTLLESVIEDRCKKVLRYKFTLHLTKRPTIKISGLMQRLNTPYVASLIEKLETGAVTMIKNSNNIIPMSDSFKNIACIYTGNLSNYSTFLSGLEERYNVGKFAITSDLSVASRKKIEEQLKTYDRVIICVNRGNLERLNTYLGGFNFDTPVSYIIFKGGEKLYQMEEVLKKSDAAILAHSTSRAVQKFLLDVLFGRKEASGKLATSVGNSFPAGYSWKKKLKIEKPILAKELGLDITFLSKIDTIAKEAIDKKAFPGCQIVVLKGGFPIYNKAFGTFQGGASKKVTETDVYDLASLSKTTGTLLAVMKLYDKGLFNLSDYVSDYLPSLKNTDKDKITIEELLFHESGMGAGLSVYNYIIDVDSYSGSLFRAYRDSRHSVQLARRIWANPNYKFQKELTSKRPDKHHTMQVADHLWFDKSVGDSVIATIIARPLLSKKYRYSCLGFILLKQMVEKIAGEPMDVFLTNNFFSAMDSLPIHYTPLKFFRKEDIIPSTDDNFFRKERLQGFVHDELAVLQGGVSGNAGQFASATTVATIYQMILDGGFYKGKRLLSESTCDLFKTRVSEKSRRGLGFDKPNPDRKGASACLNTVPIETFGHTGFTGSCAWADPVNDFVFVLTCNRTYPSIWPNNLAKYDIRERIQQAIYDALL